LIGLINKEPEKTRLESFSDVLSTPSTTMAQTSSSDMQVDQPAQAIRHLSEEDQAASAAGASAAGAVGTTSGDKAPKAKKPRKRRKAKGRQEPLQKTPQEALPVRKVIRAQRVRRESGEPNSVIISCAGTSTEAADLAVLIESVLPATSLIFDPRTKSFEVGLKEGTALEAVIEEGLEWGGVTFPVEKPYNREEDLYEIQLSGLPLIEEDALCKYIVELLDNSSNIVRVTPIYCFCTSLHTGQAVVEVLGTLEEMTGKERYLIKEGREVFVSWRGAPPVCRRCKKEGHKERKCPIPPPPKRRSFPTRRFYGPPMPKGRSHQANHKPSLKTGEEARLADNRPARLQQGVGQQEEAPEQDTEGWKVVEPRKGKKKARIPPKAVDPPQEPAAVVAITTAPSAKKRRRTSSPKVPPLKKVMDSSEEVSMEAEVAAAISTFQPFPTKVQAQEGSGPRNQESPKLTPSEPLLAPYPLVFGNFSTENDPEDGAGVRSKGPSQRLAFVAKSTSSRLRSGKTTMDKTSRAAGAGKEADG
jgi:hypothetical protein